MRLCRALSSWLPALPYLVVEVLADHHSPTGLSVASHGTAHAERIPHLRKIYLIEPSVRQVVRVTCLRKVSPSLPSVVPLYASASRFFIAIPLLFAGACQIRFPVPHSSGCALTGHTIFTDGHSLHRYLGVWQRHLVHRPPFLLSHAQHRVHLLPFYAEGVDWWGNRINSVCLDNPQRSSLSFRVRDEICAFRLEERNPRLCRYLSVGSGGSNTLARGLVR